MKNYKSLKIWERGHDLALSTYRITQNFPPSELFGLTSQMRRSAISVPANIAEGCGRDSDMELVRFLHIALGSATELEYHLLLSRDLKFLSSEQYLKLAPEIDELKRMLASFITRVKERIKTEKS